MLIIQAVQKALRYEARAEKKFAEVFSTARVYNEITTS
jgi:hypothetical protein